MRVSLGLNSGTGATQRSEDVGYYPWDFVFRKLEKGHNLA